MNDCAPSCLGDAFATLAASQCEVILNALNNANDRHRSVHQARKAIRGLRSLLALVVDAFGADIAPIDRALKKLATSLSPLRDAHVVVATAEKLATGDEAPLWHAVVLTLEARRENLLLQALAKDPAFARRRANVLAISNAIDKLPWGQHKFKAVIRHGLERSERRIAKAEEDARRARSPASVHRWRRRVRRLRLQFEALQRLDDLTSQASQPMVHRHKAIKALSHLTDQLGWNQDLRVLRLLLNKLTDASVTPVIPALRKRLRHEIRIAGQKYRSSNT